jgi:Putative zinc-finger
MNQKLCANTKDLLPVFLAGDVTGADADSVQAHLATCEDCRAEAELIGRLRLTTPAPREELRARISEGVRLIAPAGTSGGLPRRLWMAAAATVVLALGTGLVLDRVRSEPLEIMIAEQLDSDFWPGDETMIAGGLVWDDLSDEELSVLLEDWDDEA